MAGGPPFKELILDADLPPRLRTELVGRGITATRLAELNLHRLYDEPMIMGLIECRSVEEFVLVTGDDKMPLTHRDLVRRVGLTIATVDGRWQNRGYASQESWHRDVIHRWAHRIQTHADKEIRRYARNRHALWSPRTR